MNGYEYKRHELNRLSYILNGPVYHSQIYDYKKILAR
jgi:hypothetical protein